MKKVTMQDIADKLGISKSLVSISLNNRYGVSDEMRFKIFLTAIEMGYDFDYNYKSQTTDKRNNVVVFIKKQELLANGYWSDILAGAEKVLNQNNFNLKLEVWDETTSHNMILVRIAESSADGILIINELPKEAMPGVFKLKIPVLFVDGKEYTDKDFDSIRVNNYLGGYLVAEYLAKMGHTKMAYVGDKEFSMSFRERYYGFKNYIDENENLEFLGHIYQTTYDISEDFKDSSNVVEAMKKEIRPTALFCANDDIARFVYGELAKLALKVPEDVSVIGFDNLVNSNLMNPPLTSVNVLKKDLGKTAVEMLLYRMKFKDAPKRVTLLSIELDIKDSVRKIGD